SLRLRLRSNQPKNAQRSVVMHPCTTGRIVQRIASREDQEVPAGPCALARQIHRSQSTEVDPARESSDSRALLPSSASAVSRSNARPTVEFPAPAGRLPPES